MENIGNETFTINEASQYLRCSVSGIRNLVRNKTIPFYRLGNRLYFKKSSIDKWITQQEVNNLLDSVTDTETKIKPLKSGVN